MKLILFFSVSTLGKEDLCNQEIQIKNQHAKNFKKRLKSKNPWGWDDDNDTQDNNVMSFRDLGNNV